MTAFLMSFAACAVVSIFLGALAVTGAPVRNLDLRASQASMLIALLREAGIDPAWLVAYISDSEAKRKAAEAVGIPVSTWKTVLYGLLMGARVPGRAQARRSRGTIAQAIRDAVPPAEFGSTYGRFLDYTAGLREALAEWHTWLVDEFAAETAWRNPADGRRYLTNAAGAKVALEDLGAKKWRLQAQLAAFLLQGLEAALMHGLAASAEEYGFRVLSLEHDGLVVAGDVPPEAVEAAARAAGVPVELVALVEKAFG